MIGFLFSVAAEMLFLTDKVTHNFVNHFQEQQKQSDHPDPTKSIIFFENTLDHIKIDIYEKNSWKGITPTSRNESHLSFMADQTGWSTLKSSHCESEKLESNLTDIFRGQSREFNFPEIEMICSENTNCISDHPSVFFSIHVTSKKNCNFFLVTGDSSMSTFTTPQKNDLPRTTWVHEEPVSNLHWAGEFISKDSIEFIFIASLINPNLRLNSNQRIEVAQKIYKKLNFNKER